ncbi:MAG: hypothetical protein E6Q50_18790 [Lysobacter sp.]|nr:MAG: hypothetical protein E6Q50_18790 [Lysobacter sp.]
MFRRLVCALLYGGSLLFLFFCGMLAVMGVLCGVAAIVLAILSSMPEPLAPGLAAAAMACTVAAIALLAAALLLFLIAGALAISHAALGCPIGIDLPGFAGFSGLSGAGGAQGGLPFPPLPFPTSWPPGWPTPPGLDPAKWLACLGAAASGCDCGGKTADPTQLWNGLWSKFQEGMRELDKLRAEAEEKRRALQAYVDSLGDAAPQPVKDALANGEDAVKTLDQQRQDWMAGAGQALASAMRRP